MNSKLYRTKAKRMSGTRHAEVYDKARQIFANVKKNPKRIPYVRSDYFNKEKIFLNLFWRHIHEKNWGDRARRLRFYECAIELIQKTRLNPETKENPNKSSEILHRFEGLSNDGYKFAVQIKANKRTGEKHFYSVYPRPK